jgi:hypothetical protein
MTHQHTLVRPGTFEGFRASLFSQALVLVSDFDNFRTLHRTASISIQRVLAEAWNDARLERARTRLAAGEIAPPISVVRHWLHGQAFYVVSDGNHRTVAAKEAGRCRIRARISSETWCVPHRYVLDPSAGRLWEKTTTSWLKLVTDNLDAEMQRLLTMMGVNLWKN